MLIIDPQSSSDFWMRSPDGSTVALPLADLLDANRLSASVGACLLRLGENEGAVLRSGPATYVYSRGRVARRIAVEITLSVSPGRASS